MTRDRGRVDRGSATFRKPWVRCGLAIADDHDVTVVALDTGEILSTHLIEPDKSYWRNQRRDPGRWPRSPATR